MTKQERIDNAIASWNQTRTKPSDLQQLIQKGNHLVMTKSDEQILSPFIEERIFLRMGIENGKIIFILVPDKLEKKEWGDMSQEEVDAIQIKEYKSAYDIGNPDFIDNQDDGVDITVKEALKRHYRWRMFLSSFLETEVDHPEGLFTEFRMPYASIKEKLQNDNLDHLLFSFGLTPDDEGASVSGFYADLVAWSVMKENNDIGQPLNTSLPCPPNCKK
ncbi:MAG: hypothetical protein R6V52_12670 [Bacteroidales bacterium]